MAKAGQIDKGMCLLIKEEPYLVAEREFVNPGKGSAFVRLKLKNLISGQVLREVMKSQESVEEVDVFDKPAQFLYGDADGYHFMDTETYEQFTVPADAIDTKGNYLKEGDTYDVVMWDERPIDIKIPYKMVFVVTRAEDAVKGDTVTGATKTVTLETGVQVKVPLFIKEGEKVLVNTETGDYVERVNE
jgi:elongation factor P